MPNGRHSCIVFIPNKRFILKDTVFDTGPSAVTLHYLSKADIVDMWFKDVEYFSFKKSTPGTFAVRLKGVTTDLSKEAHRKDECLYWQGIFVSKAHDSFCYRALTPTHLVSAHAGAASTKHD